MERLFIPAKAIVKIDIPEDILKKLNQLGMIGILSTIQHVHELEKVATTLLKARVIGQVLGCDARPAEHSESKVDAFLYIGSGKFHPINIKLRTKKPVYTFDPFTKAFKEIKEKDVERIQKKRKAGIIKLLSSDTIGILVTTKEGQSKMKEALRLKRDLKKKGKRPYILISETLDPNLLESFPFIECFVNSACPRIVEDSLPRPVVDIDDAFSAIHGAYEG